MNQKSLTRLWQLAALREVEVPLDVEQHTLPFGVTRELCVHRVQQALPGARLVSAERRLVPLLRASLRLELALDCAADDNAGRSETRSVVRNGVLLLASAELPAAPLRRLLSSGKPTSAQGSSLPPLADPRWQPLAARAAPGEARRCAVHFHPPGSAAGDDQALAPPLLLLDEPRAEREHAAGAADAPTEQLPTSISGWLDQSEPISLFLLFFQC